MLRRSVGTVEGKRTTAGTNVMSRISGHRHLNGSCLTTPLSWGRNLTGLHHGARCFRVFLHALGESDELCRTTRRGTAHYCALLLVTFVNFPSTCNPHSSFASLVPIE